MIKPSQDSKPIFLTYIFKNTEACLPSYENDIFGITMHTLYSFTCIFFNIFLKKCLILPLPCSEPYIVAVKSVTLTSMPPSSEYWRSEILCAGFQIYSDSDSSCTVSSSADLSCVSFPAILHAHIVIFLLTVWNRISNTTTTKKRVDFPRVQVWLLTHSLFHEVKSVLYNFGQSEC